MMFIKFKYITKYENYIWLEVMITNMLKFNIKFILINVELLIDWLTKIRLISYQMSQYPHPPD